MGFQFVFFSCTSAHSPPFWGRVEMKQKTMHQFWPHLFFLVVIKSVEADWLQDPVSHVKCHVALADCGGAEIGWFLFEPPEMGMGFEETSGNTNLTCCYSLTVENALIKWKGKLCPIAREMWDFFFSNWILFGASESSKSMGPKWVSSWVWNYNKPGTSEPFCFCRPFNDVNVANFWRRRFVFWFFGSQKLPEMFCSGPVSHEGMLMLWTQISDLKNLLETMIF